MKFAEITQEVQVARPHDIYTDIGLTPGRRRMHQLAAGNWYNDNEWGQRISTIGWIAGGR